MQRFVPTPFQPSAGSKSAALYPGYMNLSLVEFVEKLAAIIPHPRASQVIYGVVLAGNAAWRKEVVPKVPTSTEADQVARAALKLVKRDGRRRRAEADQPEALGWADLLRRVFGVDGWLCPGCGLPMRLRSVVIGAPATSRVIAGLLSARGPPDHEHHVEVRVA